MLVSRRLPSNINIIPPLNENNINKQSTLCEECGRDFNTPKGKLIHYTQMHKCKVSQSVPPIGFSKCNDKRCNTCVKGTFGNTIHVTQKNETFHIKQRITCKTANVVYCLTCKKGGLRAPLRHHFQFSYPLHTYSLILAPAQQTGL